MCTAGLAEHPTGWFSETGTQASCSYILRGLSTDDSQDEEWESACAVRNLQVGDLITNSAFPCRVAISHLYLYLEPRTTA